jgi:hypothetical protein
MKLKLCTVTGDSLAEEKENVADRITEVLLLRVHFFFYNAAKEKLVGYFEKV